MVMRIICWGSVSKAGESKQSNADRIRFGNSFCGIADGVSQSYLPGQWAEKLLDIVEKRASNIDSAELFAEIIQGDPMVGKSEKMIETSWYGKRLESRGGQTTILWCRETSAKRYQVWNWRKQTLTLFSVGDCQVFMVTNSGEFVNGWPFEQGTEYPASNGAVSETQPHVRGKLQSKVLDKQSHQILMVTDALGRYIHSRLNLENGWGAPNFLAKVFPLVLGVNGDASEALSDWVSQERNDQLADDDTTFILLKT